MLVAVKEAMAVGLVCAARLVGVRVRMASLPPTRRMHPGSSYPHAAIGIPSVRIRAHLIGVAASQ